MQVSVVATLVFKVDEEDLAEYYDNNLREFMQKTLDSMADDDVELESGVVLSVERI